MNVPTNEDVAKVCPLVWENDQGTKHVSVSTMKVNNQMTITQKGDNNCSIWVPNTQTSSMKMNLKNISSNLFDSE